MRYMAVCARKRRLLAGILATASLTMCPISPDIVLCSSRSLSATISWSGSLASASQADRSIEVPVGLFGEVAGIVAKITLLTKLSRRNEVSDEKVANGG